MRCTHPTAPIWPSGTTGPRPRCRRRPGSGARAPCTERPVLRLTVSAGCRRIPQAGDATAVRCAHPHRSSTARGTRPRASGRRARLAVMRTRPLTPASASAHRISGPDELVQAIPYLLGFQPDRSLVLVGLHERQLVVTARLDLADARGPDALEHTISAVVRGGTSAIVAAVWDDDPDVAAIDGSRPGS